MKCEQGHPFNHSNIQIQQAEYHWHVGWEWELHRLIHWHSLSKDIKNKSFIKTGTHPPSVKGYKFECVETSVGIYITKMYYFILK